MRFAQAALRKASPHARGVTGFCSRGAVPVAGLAAMALVGQASFGCTRGSRFRPGDAAAAPAKSSGGSGAASFFEHQSTGEVASRFALLIFQRSIPVLMSVRFGYPRELGTLEGRLHPKQLRTMPIPAALPGERTRAAQGETSEELRKPLFGPGHSRDSFLPRGIASSRCATLILRSGTFASGAFEHNNRPGPGHTACHVPVSSGSSRPGGRGGEQGGGALTCSRLS